MDENFVKDFSTYDNICYGFLREFFIVKPNPLYPRLIQNFYPNLNFEGISITSRIGETNIGVTTYEFQVMCKVPDNGKTYKVKAPDGTKKFDHTIAAGSFFINPMRKKRLSFKTKFMKAICRFVHYLMTHVHCQIRQSEITS